MSILKNTALIGLALSSLASAMAQADQTVLIGLAGPLTGPSARIGKDLENGAKLAIDQANAKHPKINGKAVTFKLVSEDDQSDPRTAVTVAQRLDGECMFFANKEEVSLYPGDVYTVEVNISNTATLAGMQCYVTIPEGLELVENEDGLLFDLPEELAEVFGMRIGTDQADKGIYFFGLASVFNEPLPEEGVIFSFNVKATEALPETAQILIDQFLVASKSSVTYPLDDQINITVSNAIATGINAAKATVAGAEYFTVGGQRVAAPQKGINVVKMANGEVKKIRF